MEFSNNEQIRSTEQLNELVTVWILYMLKNVLSLKNIHLCFEDVKTIFDGLSCTFRHGKNGLIGRNGAGKSTLLRLASGELKAFKGNVERSGKLVYCKQHNGVISPKSIGEWLGIDKTLAALARIEAGIPQSEDFERVGDRWSLRSDLMSTMDGYGLSHLNLETPVAQLSGGEITRIHLAFAFSSKPDILLLDEPSNNLDSNARKQLYFNIDFFNGILVVASHDRKLLERVDRIYELTTLGLCEYGGAYSFYREQKNCTLRQLMLSFMLELVNSLMLERKFKSVEKFINRVRLKVDVQRMQ